MTAPASFSRPRILISNETTWHTGDLRTVVAACEAWLGLGGKWCRRVRVAYGRRRGFTGGHAYMNGGSVALFPPAAIGTVRRWAHDPVTGVGSWRTMESRRVDALGNMDPDTFRDFASTVEHELLHVAGWTHRRMWSEKHPAYHGHATLPKWADGLRVRARLPRPKITPGHGARLAEAHARDSEALLRWSRKAKLAATKIRKLKNRMAARERRLLRAARPSNELT